jgi:hypothetical protein
MSKADITKQVEYYLSDLNLKKDKFFHSKISESEDGWLSIAVLLNCNKLKQLKIKAQVIADSCKDSTAVEVSDDGQSVRRKDNKALPALETGSRRREDKAASKEEAKGEEEEKEEEVFDGFLMEEDFNSPHIIRFTTVDKVEADTKVDWKGIVEKVKEKCPRIKVAYVRSDATSGEIAISKHKLQKATFDGLLALKFEHDKLNFTFAQLDGEDLEKFWGDHGGHY